MDRMFSGGGSAGIRLRHTMEKRGGNAINIIRLYCYIASWRLEGIPREEETADIDLCADYCIVWTAHRQSLCWEMQRWFFFGLFLP
jgi:hypothetical protein